MSIHVGPSIVLHEFLCDISLSMSQVDNVEIVLCFISDLAKGAPSVILLVYWSPEIALMKYGSSVHKGVGIGSQQNNSNLGIQIRATGKCSSGTKGEISKVGSGGVAQDNKALLNLGIEESKAYDCGDRSWHRTRTS